MAIGDNIIDALGISWVLDTSSAYATLTYAHPVLGLLQYTGTATWIVDNVNTVHLTSRGSLPGPEDEGYVKVLPDEVCIRPLYDANGCGCYDTTEKYDTVENQCACKDPACDCIPEKICLDCDGTVECCEGNACIGRDGVDNPSGPGYELCCTLLGVNVCGVWYCSAGQWKVDIYCNDVLITTNGISHEGCPLKLGTTGFDGCDDCVVCVGDDCEPPPPGCGDCVAFWNGSGWFVTGDCDPSFVDCASATCGNAISAASPGTFVGEIRNFPCITV